MADAGHFFRMPFFGILDFVLLENKSEHRLYPILTLLAVLAIYAFFLGLLINPISPDDGLRHFAMARLMAVKGIFNVQGWSEFMFFGYLHEHIVDPWFLSEVLYIPFTGLPIAIGLHLFSLFTTAILGGSFYLCLRTLKINQVVSSLLILLLFLGDYFFSYRLLIGRPFPLVTALTLLIFVSIVRGRYLPVVFLMALLTLLSHLFIFSLGVIFLGGLWLAALGRKSDVVRLAVFAIFGVVLGFLFHPNPLNYLNYLGVILLRIPLMNLPDRGSELLSGIEMGGLFFVFTGLAVLFHVVIYKDNVFKKADKVIFLLDALVAAFFVQFMMWSRAEDFLWPLLLLLVGKLASDHGDSLNRLIDFTPGFLRSLKGLMLLILLVCLSQFGPLALKLRLAEKNKSLMPYADALNAVEPGAKIINVEWDWFPALVAVRPDLKYATAMDPMFTVMSGSGATKLINVAYPPNLGNFDNRKYIDARRWLKDLFAYFGGDYVLLAAKQNGPVISTLREEGFKDLSGNSDWAVFKRETKESKATKVTND